MNTFPGVTLHRRDTLEKSITSKYKQKSNLDVVCTLLQTGPKFFLVGEGGDRKTTSYYFAGQKVLKYYIVLRSIAKNFGGGFNPLAHPLVRHGFLRSLKEMKGCSVTKAISHPFVFWLLFSRSYSIIHG